MPYRSADVEEIGRASRSFEKMTGVGYNGAFDEDWRRLDHYEDRRVERKIVATWLPARRAMRVNPIEVLRAQ